MTRMVCCLAALLWLALPLSAAKKPEVKRIYMFGFAASLRDSTAFQTDIQTIDSAWIDPTHKILVDRALCVPSSSVPIPARCSANGRR